MCDALNTADVFFYGEGGDQLLTCARADDSNLRKTTVVTYPIVKSSSHNNTAITATWRSRRARGEQQPKSVGLELQGEINGCTRASVPLFLKEAQTKTCVRGVELVRQTLRTTRPVRLEVGSHPEMLHADAAP